ncbi:MFS transporter [Actinosynnema sp. CA-248983]
MSHTARRAGFALALLAATQFVLVLDASIVGVALPSIGAALDFTPDGLSWVANAYVLAFGGLLLLGGRAADLLGRRRMYMTGMALFTAASLLGALSPNAFTLVTARALQGVGAAVVAPAALSLIMTIFPPGAGRTKALGVFGAVAGTGGAAGSILGGLLTEWLGWEATLYVNVPIGILVIALSPRLLPEASDTSSRGIDVLGALTATSGLTLLVYTLVNLTTAPVPQSAILGLASLTLITLFFVVESRSPHPLVPLGIFRLPTLRASNIVTLLTTMSMLPLFFFLSFYTQQVLHYGPVSAGLAQLPLAISIAVTASFASGLVGRYGLRLPMSAGLTVMAAGLAWFSLLPADGTFIANVLFQTIVIGIGAGLAFVTTTVGATTGGTPSQAGLTSGIFTTAQQFGGSLGLAIAVTAATATTGTATDPATLANGYQSALTAAAITALAAAALTILLIPRHTAPVTAPHPSPRETPTHPPAEPSRHRPPPRHPPHPATPPQPRRCPPQTGSD